MMTKEDIKSNLEESKIEKSKETVKEPVKEVAEETVEEPVKEVAEEIVEESTKDTAEEIVEESSEEPAKEITEEPTEEIIEEPAETSNDNTEEVEATETKESISDLKMKIKEELKEELKSELKEDIVTEESSNEDEEEEEEELDTKSQFLLNYQTRETMITAIVIAVLAFLNSFVTHLFDGADDTVIIPIFATISSLVCFGTVGTYFYMAAQYETEKFKSSVVKLAMISSAVLIFTAIIQLLVVIFF